MNSRWRCPPESEPNDLPHSASSPHSPTASRETRRSANSFDGLADAHPLGQVRVLELAPDTGSERAPLPCGIAPEEPDRPGIRTAEPLGALDHRRLAGAVQAEDAEDLAFGDRQVDAVDRDDVAVPLA